jgi:DHA2 family methylenomycin A resistance protein-like MFS transporter
VNQLFWITLKPSVSPFRSHATLVAAALGFVLVLLDVSVVNVALEALRQEFGADVSGLQWVLNAYTLVFAALLLTSGALGDRFGARRTFTCGLVLFTLASAACGLAPNLVALVAARAIQGLGAALLVPNSLSMLQQAFPDPVQRSRAVGWWGAIGGASLAAGPVLGGLLIAHAGWRSIFLINLPVGLIGLCLAVRPTESGNAVHHHSLDLPGQVAIVSALAALTVALTEAGRLGWQHSWVQGGLMLALLAALAFVRVERRSPAPMLPLALFRIPTFTVASLAGVIVNFAYYGLIFVFSLFFQIEQQLSPEQTGLAFLPMTIVLMVVNVIAGRLITRIGARRLMALGLGLAAFGYLLLLPVRIDGPYGMLVVPMLLAASGIALTVPTMTNATLSSVERSRAGIASGVLNSARQVGGMLGVAVFGYLVRDTAPEAFMRGMHRSLGISVALLLAASLLCLFGMPEDRTRAS